jgi:hypothetical protein
MTLSCKHWSREERELNKIHFQTHKCQETGTSNYTKCAEKQENQTNLEAIIVVVLPVDEADKTLRWCLRSVPFGWGAICQRGQSRVFLFMTIIFLPVQFPNSQLLELVVTAYG